MRRILLSVTLWSAALAGPPAGTPVEQRYAEARKYPPELYAFLLRMPKGGDLHLHSSGAIYAETYLRIAAEDRLCLDLRTHSIDAQQIARVAGTISYSVLCGIHARVKRIYLDTKEPADLS